MDYWQIDVKQIECEILIFFIYMWNVQVEQLWEMINKNDDDPSHCSVIFVAQF